MSEIAKCPICGGVPLDKWEVTSARVFQTGQTCCGVDCNTNERWNQYAAAMELAKTEAWEAETDEVRAYLDDTLEDCDAWEEIVDTNIAAERAAFDARDRVVEVFNG